MTPRSTRKKRLEGADWLYVPGGWLPSPLPPEAHAFMALIDSHAPEAERIATTGQSRGKPRKEATE